MQCMICSRVLASGARNGPANRSHTSRASVSIKSPRNLLYSRDGRKKFGANRLPNTEFTISIGMKKKFSS